MKGNFEACLTEVLRHEGSFVNQPRLAMVNKSFYAWEWSTQQNSPKKSILPFKWKVRHFIEKWSLETQDPMLAASMVASTMLMLEDYAMRITSENAMAKIYPHHSGIEAREASVWNAIAPLTARVDGRFVRVITIKGDAPLYAQFALRPLGDVVLNVVCHIHTMFTTFITQGVKGKTLRLVRPSKALAQKLLRQKSQSAFCYAQIATG